jgi:hypothetical protein
VFYFYNLRWPKRELESAESPLTCVGYDVDTQQQILGSSVVQPMLREEEARGVTLLGRTIVYTPSSERPKGKFLEQYRRCTILRTNLKVWSSYMLGVASASKYTSDLLLCRDG